MGATHPQILREFNSQYRRMFKQLLAGNVPLAFNCSAGKDRTGVAAALILTALGVSRETVIQDYLLSNCYFDPAKASSGIEGSAMPGAWKTMSPETTKVLMGVDRSYILGVFKVIDTHPGGQAGYLRDALDLGPAEMAVLRRRYTPELRSCRAQISKPASSAARSQATKTGPAEYAPMSLDIKIINR